MPPVPVELAVLQTHRIKEPKSLAVVLRARTLSEVEDGQRVRYADPRMDGVGHNGIPISALGGGFRGA